MASHPNDRTVSRAWLAEGGPTRGRADTEGGGAIGRRRRAALDAGGDEYHSKRREVIQAAAAVFRHKGYRATTLSDVAEALDTNRATLYYYVSGKDELLREAVTDDLLDLLDDVRRISGADASAQVKLREFITKLMNAHETNNPHPYVFVQESMEETWGEHADWAKELVSLVTQLQDRVAGILKQGITDGELRADLPVELVVNALFGMINWTYRWNRPGARYLVDEVGECFAALFLEGLVSPGSARHDCRPSVSLRDRPPSTAPPASRRCTCAADGP